VDGFVTLVTHFGETAGQVSGPVKIVEMGASLAKQGGSSLFLYTALISINLAVLNSLPLPMLDGGQFVLLLLEGLRRKPLPEKFQMAFMQSGFVLLVGLSVVDSAGFNTLVSATPAMAGKGDPLIRAVVRASNSSCVRAPIARPTGVPSAAKNSSCGMPLTS